MNFRTLILFTMPVIFFSCINKTDTKNNIDKDSTIIQAETKELTQNSSIYDDINLFKLEGVGKIEQPTKYPYIVVENQNKLKKRVIYKHSSADSFEIIYENKGYYWLGEYEFRADTGYHRTYEYIKPDTIIQLSYYGTYMKTGFHLDDITIIEKGKSTMYSYWSKTGPFLEPDIKNFNLLKNKVNVVVKEESKRKNGILTIYSQSIDKIKNQVFESDTSCFNIGEHSWFWFQRFGWDKKVECN